jgi:hypothetical protein
VSSKRTADRFKGGLASEAVPAANVQHAGHGRHGRAGGESGAVLILALVYIVAISLIVGALADWAMNDLNNTTKFNSTGELRTAVSSVTNLAIQNIRYTPEPSSPTDLTQTSLGNCWVPTAAPVVSQYSIDGYTVEVVCTTYPHFEIDQTRIVTLYACLSSLNASSTSGAISASWTNCPTSAVLTAKVVFDDYPTQGAPGQTVQCNTPPPAGLGQCGEGMKLLSWIWG